MNATRRKWMTTTSLLVSLGVLSACAKPGDFCEVVRGEIVFEAETAQAVVRTDRPTAEQIAAQNAYWRDNCP